MRLVERKRVCRRCERELPWSQFRPRTLWDDGTARTVNSYCWACERDNNRARARRRYELLRSQILIAQAERRARLLADRETAAEYQARAREYRATYRRKNGAQVRNFRQRTSTEPRRFLPVGPFRDWLEAQLAATPPVLFAAQVGTPEKTLYWWRTTNTLIADTTVDDVGCALGEPRLLEELYGDILADTQETAA